VFQKEKKKLRLHLKPGGILPGHLGFWGLQVGLQDGLLCALFSLTSRFSEHYPGRHVHMTVSRQAVLHQTQDRFIVILSRSTALFHAKANQ